MQSKAIAVREIVTHSPLETERLGGRLGIHLESGDVVCLEGDLGTGKTCLVRGLAHGWGQLGRVTSPTFTLINEYRRASDHTRFYHVDCYRLDNATEAWSLGLEDVLTAPGVVAVEWAERIRAILPAEALWVHIEDAGNDQRRLKLMAYGMRAAALLRSVDG